MAKRSLRRKRTVRDNAPDESGVAVWTPPNAPVSQWTPPAGKRTVTHGGETAPEFLIYLAPPPPSIGAVRSVASSVNTITGADPYLGMRLGFAAAGLLIAVGFVFWASRQHPVAPVWYGVWGAVGAGAFFLVSGNEYGTSYVGETGAAWHVYGNKAKPVRRTHVLSFADGDNALFMDVAKIYGRHGGYVGTAFSAIWLDKTRTVFQITGQKATAPEHRNFAFVLAAEKAWTDFRLAVCRETVDAGETAWFPVVKAGKVWGRIGVAATVLTVEKRGGKSESIPLNALEKVTLLSRKITVRAAGGNPGVFGIGAHGAYTFAYAEVGNARVFLKLLRRVCPAVMNGVPESPPEYLSD